MDVVSFFLVYIIITFVCFCYFLFSFIFMYIRKTIQEKPFFFFKLLFGCPKAKFGLLLRGQPHSPDVNHCVLHFRPEDHWEPRNEALRSNIKITKKHN